MSLTPMICRFYGSFQNFFQHTTLTLCASNLIWGFQCTIAQLNSMNAQEILYSPSVMNATITCENTRSSKWLKPSIQQCFCTNAAFRNSTRRHPPCLVIEGSKANHRKHCVPVASCIMDFKAICRDLIVEHHLVGLLDNWRLLDRFTFSASFASKMPHSFAGF